MPKFQKFNDGIVYVCAVVNTAENGDRPKEELTTRLCLRFGYSTIGVKRNYEAMQAQVMLSELISVPMHREISPQDVAVICGVQYRIEQVQHKTDTLPPTSLLSLSRLEADYEFKTVQKSSADSN